VAHELDLLFVGLRRDVEGPDAEKVVGSRGYETAERLVGAGGGGDEGAGSGGRGPGYGVYAQPVRVEDLVGHGVVFESAAI